MERVVQVFMDAPSGATPVGKLWARSRQGIESATFMYDAAWLARADCFALEPALPLTAGPITRRMARRCSGPWGIQRRTAGAGS